MTHLTFSPTPGKLMLATLPAVLGNTLGFYLSYRAPHLRALSKFLLPAAAFFVLFMLPALWALLMGSGLGAFAAAALINIVPVAIAVPILLGLRPAAARRPFTSARVNTGA
ncbi:hypothetical protein DAETH_39010 (plasmid) [Deinococcus aetherius]|uniref:Uncharacterized protein n=1 Tax=Deinococcus aetherius TaxID=200252 RepID=A0ABN6RKS2_9DEIO|nr:hypothetical protein [Deinococcus aetherius]BDP43932.1 hypothetical protein DAETH_39010 [Deinococcus aetherius]